MLGALVFILGYLTAPYKLSYYYYYYYLLTYLLTLEMLKILAPFIAERETNILPYWYVYKG